MNIHKACLLLATSAFISGCMTIQDKKTAMPEFSVPGKFQSTSAQIPVGAAQSNWLRTFDDPKLDAFVQEVFQKNFDLQIAATNMDAAAASAKLAGAALSPAVSIGAQATNQGNLETGLKGNASTVGTSLDVSWELDVWGRLRAGRDAASEELLASRLDYEFAKLSLAAQTAKAYFLAVEARRQLDLNKSNIDSYSKTLEVVNAFFDEGMVSIQDIHLTKSEKARAEDALGNAKSAHREALRSLEALLGRYPSASVEIAADLPALPAPVPIGIPSDILERRPDIVAAERRVAAAFDKVTEAQAAKLPRISLTGSLGGASSALSDLTSPANLVWTAVSSLMFPIFDGGKLDAQVEAATATQKQALANYQKTALSAFGDIEKSLSNEAIFRNRQRSLKTAYQQAKLAEEIGRERYTNGEGNLLDVLQLQRATISSQVALSKIEHDLLVQRVNLHLGLGGNLTQ